MSEFTIKDVEALTGIKPHTLRIWEQRYNFLKPKRTHTNIRYYDDNDLKILLNAALLNQNGFKISKIAKLTQQEIEQIILEFTAEKADKCFQMQGLIKCMLQLDECNFEQIISSNFTMNGVAHTMMNLIFPFLDHLGALCMSGSVSPAFEHYITTMLRCKLIVATERLGYNGNPKIEKKKYLLFLPECECHEIGLLFANYYIREGGHATVYLGQNLPLHDMHAICKTYNPHYIFTSVTTAMTEKKLWNFFDGLLNISGIIPVLITGRIATQSKTGLPEKFNVIRSTEDLDFFMA